MVLGGEQYWQLKVMVILATPPENLNNHQVVMWISRTEHLEITARPFTTPETFTIIF